MSQVFCCECVLSFTLTFSNGDSNEYTLVFKTNLSIIGYLLWMIQTLCHGQTSYVPGRLCSPPPPPPPPAA